MYRWQALSNIDLNRGINVGQTYDRRNWRQKVAGRVTETEIRVTGVL